MTTGLEYMENALKGCGEHNWRVWQVLNGNIDISKLNDNDIEIIKEE